VRRLSRGAPKLEPESETAQPSSAGGEAKSLHIWRARKDRRRLLLTEFPFVYDNERSGPLLGTLYSVEGCPLECSWSTGCAEHLSCSFMVCRYSCGASVTAWAARRDLRGVSTYLAETRSQYRQHTLVSSLRRCLSNVIPHKMLLIDFANTACGESWFYFCVTGNSSQADPRQIEVA
jgi:hypothetical protein